MGERQGRPSAVNLCPFVGEDFNQWPTVHNYSRHRADTDVKMIKNENKEKQSKHIRAK